MEIRAVVEILIAEGGKKKKEVETEAPQTPVDCCNSSDVLLARC